MWSVECIADPVEDGWTNENKPVYRTLASATCSMESLLVDSEHRRAFQEGKRISRVALADYVARVVAKKSNAETTVQKVGSFRVVVEPLDRHVASKKRGKSKKNRSASGNGNSYVPYILERTDVYCTTNDLNLMMRVLLYNGSSEDGDVMDVDFQDAAKAAVQQFLSRCFRTTPTDDVATAILRHVACAVAQNRIREKLVELKAVAFVADGSILPRKSGASSLPMASPPAIPFEAPKDSPTRQEVKIDMGSLRPFFSEQYSSSNGTVDSTVTITGLVVFAGVTLICGGGYHGKSTLLRCIAAGVYDKIPGDGREMCVTVRDAVTVRAEDGRFVSCCNVSAFISNLPTPPGATKAVDTTQFSTGDASGSTSQAANVSEAIEMGAQAMLVDEDVSAANFMARDGRMRSLVADESITPLLYRVNGLFKSHGISSIVVVGGVGDWLDVPDTVFLLNRYEISDATQKARSVSYQFSYGHVQYAGRGTTHRLEWEKEGTPIPRRPTEDFVKSSGADTVVSLMEGGHVLSVHSATDEQDENDDEEAGFIDMSRCEQLVGKKAHLYGCGLGVVQLLTLARENPQLSINALLDKLEATLDADRGAPSLLSRGSASETSEPSDLWTHLVESVGFAYRPRRHEIFMALTRLRGIQLENLPMVDDGSDAAAAAEVERKKQELMELWNSRRSKNWK